MRNSITNEEIQAFANRLMFRIKDEEMDTVRKEFGALNEMLKSFQEIDTEGVEEMVYPFEEATTYLRDDVVDEVLTSEEVLANAPAQKAGHIQLPKVVK